MITTLITFACICVLIILYNYQISSLRIKLKSLYYQNMYQISYLRCLYINQLKLIEGRLILEERFEEVQKVQELIQNEINNQEEDINNFKNN